MVPTPATNPFGSVDLGLCMTPADWVDVEGHYIRKSAVVAFYPDPNLKCIIIVTMGDLIRVPYEGERSIAMSRLVEFLCGGDVAVPLVVL